MVATGLVPAADAVREDRGLEVRRRWLGLDGEPVDPSTLEVGDLVQVEVTIRTLPDATPRLVHNIAVVDLLPGGVEVEHPRLATSASVASAATTGLRRDRRGRPRALEPSRVEFLDDRVVMFTSASSRLMRHRYAVRVTTPGTFRVPPIEAACMYAPDIASVHGGGEMVAAR
jgi:uncharacterized protein YfaS (alpha-2-macroglobulin family)